MELTQVQAQDVQEMVQSPGWSIFKQWCKEHMITLDELSEKDLEEGLQGILQREQILGAKKHLKFRNTDFENFVLTQTHKTDNNNEPE
jgi:hypothetical protein